VVLFLEFVDDPFVAARLLSITVSFIRWVNRFTEVDRIRKEQNRIIKTSKVRSDVIEFSFNVLVCLTESGGNDDKIFSEVNLGFGSGAAFVER
jgi:hypothetical protein